jgi:hypothetical protein
MKAYKRIILTDKDLKEERIKWELKEKEFKMKQMCLMIYAEVIAAFIPLLAFGIFIANLIY